MTVLLVLLYDIFYLFLLLNGQDCSWSNGLDLRSLNGENMQCVFELDTTTLLYFQPCQSNMQCSWSDTDRYMVTQNYQSGNCAAGIALFDDTQPQQITVDGQTAFKFEYANGETSFSCFNPRTLDLTFICDPSADPYDINNLKCGENPNTICSYYLTVYTKYACISYNDTSSDDGLSTGSIILILLFVFIIIYCVGGFVFNAIRNPDKDWTDFQYNCPNLSFWRLLPKLVSAGCATTYYWIQTKRGKNGDSKDGSNTYSELDDDIEETQQ